MDECLLSVLTSVHHSLYTVRPVCVCVCVCVKIVIISSYFPPFISPSPPITFSQLFLPPHQSAANALPHLNMAQRVSSEVMDVFGGVEECRFVCEEKGVTVSRSRGPFLVYGLTVPPPGVYGLDGDLQVRERERVIVNLCVVVMCRCSVCVCVCEIPFI